MQIKVNDKMATVTASPDTPLLYVLSGLGARRRRREALVRDAGVGGRRQIRDDARGAADVVRGEPPPCARARDAPGAAGDARRAGAAVRLLLQRHDREGRRAAVEESEA